MRLTPPDSTDHRCRTRHTVCPTILTSALLPARGRLQAQSAPAATRERIDQRRGPKIWPGATAGGLPSANSELWQSVVREMRLRHHTERHRFPNPVPPVQNCHQGESRLKIRPKPVSFGWIASWPQKFVQINGATAAPCVRIMREMSRAFLSAHAAATLAWRVASSSTDSTGWQARSYF